MLTEDYLMRIINQVLAALLKAIGLKKKGEYEQAQQALDQAFEQLTGLPANMLKGLDDAGLLAALTAQGQVDIGRLAVLADLFWEEGDILDRRDRRAAGTASAARALRLYLEVVLADDGNLSAENIRKVEAARSRLSGQALPEDTLLALYDYCGRLLGMDDGALKDAGLSRGRVEADLAALQSQLGLSSNPTDG